MVRRYYQNLRHNVVPAGCAEHGELQSRSPIPDTNKSQFFAIPEIVDAPEANSQTFFVLHEPLREQTHSLSKPSRQLADQHEMVPSLLDGAVVDQKFSFMGKDHYWSISPASSRGNGQRRQDDTTIAVSHLPTASYPSRNQPRATRPPRPTRYVKHQGQRSVSVRMPIYPRFPGAERAMEPSRALGGLGCRMSPRKTSYHKGERQIASHGPQLKNYVPHHSYLRNIPARPPGQRYYPWALSERDIKFIDARFGR